VVGIKIEIVADQESEVENMMGKALATEGPVYLKTCGQELELEITSADVSQTGYGSIFTLKPLPPLSELETEIKAADETLTDLQKKYRRLTGKDYRWFK
jgi:hypothetical protein